MITSKQFQAAVTSLQQLLPMGKQLTPAALILAWDTLPERAKLDLTDEILLFAVRQRLLDPEPPKDLAPHLALLRYAYHLQNDRPMVEHGLRADLARRMAVPDRFHDPAPARQEQEIQEAPRLVAGPERQQSWAMTTTQRKAHVERIAATVARIRVDGMDDRVWTPAQLKTGRWWFEKALQGLWSMEIDGAAIAAAWVLRNPAWADELISVALAGDLEPVAPEKVVPSFAGAR